MKQPTLFSIAEAVARELVEYHAAVIAVPEFDLKELNRLQVVVVPTGTECKCLSRTSQEVLHKISIGVLKRITEEELPEMLALCEAIGMSFLGKHTDGATCIAVEFNPIYSAEHLRERRQFTSVLQLSFKLVR